MMTMNNGERKNCVEFIRQPNQMAEILKHILSF